MALDLRHEDEAGGSAAVRGGTILANRFVKLKSGRVLDESLIEKLASEAESGYEPSLARRVVLKRPQACPRRARRLIAVCYRTHP